LITHIIINVVTTLKNTSFQRFFWPSNATRWPATVLRSHLNLKIATTVTQTCARQKWLVADPDVSSSDAFSSITGIFFFPSHKDAFIYPYDDLSKEWDPIVQIANWLIYNFLIKVVQ